MKLKHIAAFFMLLLLGVAVGCTAQTDTAPAANSDTASSSSDSDVATTVEPADDTLAAAKVVSFTVTGMK